jgi:hypothetical protein
MGAEQRGDQPRQDTGNKTRREFLKLSSDTVIGGSVVVTGAVTLDGAFEKEKPLWLRRTRGVLGAAAILGGVYVWIAQPLESMRAREHSDPTAQNKISPPDNKTPPKK